jgi:hypothetical protein
MKMSLIAMFAVLLLGCKSSPQPSSLNPGQLGAGPVQASNTTGETPGHYQPFPASQSTRFQKDFELGGELAAGGSTNTVRVEFLNNMYAWFLSEGGQATTAALPPPSLWSLTPQQAGAVAMQAANHEADSLYHCRPFLRSHPAQFAKDRWIWNDAGGFGNGDFSVRAELALDGSIISMRVEILDNRIEVMRGIMRYP